MTQPPNEQMPTGIRNEEDRKQFRDSKERIYTFRVDLEEGPADREFAHTQIARTIQMSGNHTLQIFHTAIFEAFDRLQERLYEFNMGEKPFDTAGARYTDHELYADSARQDMDAFDTAATVLDSLGLTVGQTFYYVFDFGDYWIHRISVVAVEEGPAAGDFPRVLESIGPSPPQFHPLEKESAEEQPAAEVPGMAEAMMEYLQSQWRDELERKPLRVSTDLRAALNKLPASWVRAICAHVGLPAARRKKEYVAALAAYLPHKKSLEHTWARLPEPSRRIIRWLAIDRQGSATASELFEAFGVDTDKSWYWDEGEIPTTPLGILRLHGLVFVGTAKLAREKEKVTVIPVELREGLSALAKGADAFKGAPPMPGQHEQTTSSIEDEEVAKYLEDVVLGGPREKLAELTDLEHFLEIYPFSRTTEWLYLNVIKSVSSRPRDFHPDTIRMLLERMIKGGRTDGRLLAYELSLVVFGRTFAAPALDDPSMSVRQWAQKILGHTTDESS